MMTVVNNPAYASRFTADNAKRAADAYNFRTGGEPVTVVPCGYAFIIQTAFGNYLRARG